MSALSLRPCIGRGGNWNRIETVSVEAAPFVATLAGAEGQRPAEPPAVLVHAVAVSDPARTEELDSPVREVCDRVQRREDSFCLAESAESAAVVLRVTDSRTRKDMRREIGHNRVRERMFEFRFADAVPGEDPESLTGPDEREVRAGLRNAASHLVDEPERSCEKHCAISG